VYITNSYIHEECRFKGCDTVWLLLQPIHVIQLLIAANVVPSWSDFVTLMMTSMRSVQTSASVLQFLVTANVLRSSPIPVTLMMDAISSSETSVLTRGTRRNIPEDAILHSYRRVNFKSYIALTGWTL
jgi:hypothetical protein